MIPDIDSRFGAVLPVLGTLYLVYLSLQSPPARWIGIGCLVVLTPFLAGWLLGNYADVGPWADSDDQ